MINISHYVSTETLSRKEIHMFETRTHTQCLPDYSIHWWAWLQEETQSNTSCNTLLCHLHKQQHSSAGYLPGQFSCGHTHRAMIQYICICLCTYISRSSTLLSLLHTSRGNRICGCTRLQTTYAHKLDISILLYTPNNQDITLYVPRHDVTQGDTHVRGTHTQAMKPYYCTHWWAWLAGGELSPILD